MTEWDIFVAALEIENAAERAAYLDQACGGNAELRRRIENMLNTQEQLGSFLDKPAELPIDLAADETQDYQHDANQPSDRIGPYKLLERLGFGGMGEVWLAEQEQPVRRRVALKLIKVGMDTQQVLARFEAERQALALMDHPNIAKVFDAGRSENGRPYFVMELVKGTPVTVFCDEEKLPLRERLELFLPICQAVQHAHQKGIIHRDLKPSNILVALIDGKPVPKVIDFGVAKAIHQKLTEQTLFTAVGMMVGTPEYMAPEQAKVNNVDIDTRADIYSLGVVLYELLAGSPPFAGKQLREAAYDEMLRIIREVEPPKPSTKLSSSDELPSIAARRKLEPKRLSKLVQGELDWITMKCLEKERARRYETANGLAMDIQRHLCDEAVMAGPPSRVYRVKKFVWRNKGGVVAASLVILSLLLGLTGTAWGWQTAYRRLEQVERSNDVLASILSKINPFAKLAEPLQVILARRLELAATQLDHDSIGDPLVVAKIQNILGESLMGFDNHKTAITLFAKALRVRSAHLGPSHRDTLICQGNLADAFLCDGQYQSALRLMRETVRDNVRFLGADDPSTVLSRNNYAVALLKMGRYREAISEFESVSNVESTPVSAADTSAIQIKVNLALAHQKAGSIDKAIDLFEKCRRDLLVTMTPDHPFVLITCNNLGLAYLDNGRHDNARSLLEETLQKSERKLGMSHSITLGCYNSLGVLYRELRLYDRSIQHLERALSVNQDVEARTHPSTLSTRHNLAYSYRLAGRLADAIREGEATLDGRMRVLGRAHADTLETGNNLAVWYAMDAKWEKATRLAEKIVSACETNEDVPVTLAAKCHQTLGTLWFNQGEFQRAMPYLEKSVQLYEKSLSAVDPKTLESRIRLASTYLQLGRHNECLRQARLAAQGMETLSFEHENAQKIIGFLVRWLEAQNEISEAESWRRKWLAHIEEKSGADSTAYAAELSGLGLNLIHQTKCKDAKPILRDALRIREQQEPDAWSTFNTKSMLGEAVFQLARSTSKEGDPENPARAAGYQEAEKLLLAGYDGMKQRQDKIPKEAKVRLNEAVERLIQLYDAWNKPDEAAKWRKELEELKQAASPKPATKPDAKTGENKP